MKRFVRSIAKAVAAAVGIGVLVYLSHSRITVPGLDQMVSDLIYGAFATWGVWQVRNGEKPKVEDFRGENV